MPKTITVRIDDEVYDIFKRAADGQKRTISNYLEFATLNYTVNETIVDDNEMSEILSFGKDLKKRMGLHFEMFKNRNQVICKARERNPLRWSSKIRQYKISEIEVLNSAKKSA